MDITFIVSFITCIIFLLIFGKILLFPMKKIIYLVLHSLLGAVIIWIINIVGTSFGFHIGLNVISAILVGLLGIPGAILLILLKIFCGIG